MAVEIYSPERRAEFLLSNTTNEEEYQSERTEVVAMGPLVILYKLNL